MDLGVVGRRVLFFDDDATASFVNSEDALVEWNSIYIDRYDVRHLLQGPLPPRRRPHSQGRSSLSPTPPPPDQFLEAELDQERYLDLPQLSHEDEVTNDLKREVSGTYRAVEFSYGDPHDSTAQKDVDAGLGHAGFRPPFPVPDCLLQNLPPAEKVHQIIARTAAFVSKHGGQSEIVLRVKHGDNPTFGFLMPDHHLHPYFRFLVDKQEILKLNEDGKHQFNSNTVEGGALSLLGCAYGSGEDEDGATEDAPEVVEKNSDALKPAGHNGREKASASLSVSMNPLPSKEKVPFLKRSGVKAGIKADYPGPTSVNKVPSTSKDGILILEPPADTKRVIDKIVVFILKNGKDFEAVLIEQDNKHGRFPFLHPSNKYHPFYLNVLQKAQESKLSCKADHAVEKGDAASMGSADQDIPFESDRKEKFKMVISKSKKDEPDQPPKGCQEQFRVSVDAASAAAILQAVRRGIKNPSLGFLPSSSLNGSCHALSNEGGHGLSLDANAIARTVALAAASEADSSEAGLSKEQMVKAERLKRAKMFAAMIKSGAAPLKTETSRGLSVEPPGSGFSGLLNVREGSSVLPDGDKNGKSEHDVYYKRRSYRSRSNRHDEEEDEAEDEQEGKEEVNKDDEGRHKHSRKKRHSGHSSHHNKHRRKHHKRRLSSDGDESRHCAHDDSSSDVDDHWHGKSSKHRKRGWAEREMELEEGEIRAKHLDQSKASASPYVSYPAQGEGFKPNPPEVSEDLRAKVRAMLLATL